jgi:hypothetical protein
VDISAHATVCPIGGRGIFAAAFPLRPQKVQFWYGITSASGDYNEKGMIK